MAVFSILCAIFGAIKKTVFTSLRAPNVIKEKRKWLLKRENKNPVLVKQKLHKVKHTTFFVFILSYKLG